MFKRNISILFLSSLLLLVIVTIQYQVDAAANTSPSDSLVEEIFLPNGGKPRYVAYANNALWFTVSDANVIGRFVYTPTVNYTDYTFTFYNIPTSNSEPYDLVIDGNILWFTELEGNKIGKLMMDTGQIEEFAIPTANSAPAGITVTPNGDVWFVQRNGNKIGKFDPLTSLFTEYSYPRSDALLEDLDSAPSGEVIWFTAPGIKRLGSFTIASEAFYDVTTANFNTPPFTPSQVVVDPQGDPWVSTKEGLVGRFMPATVQFFRWYQVASGNSGLAGLFLTKQGVNPQLWFAGSLDGTAGQLLLEPDGSTINKWTFPIAIPDGELYGIVATDEDVVWLADYANGSLLRWSSPYFLSVYLPIISQE